MGQHGMGVPAACRIGTGAITVDVDIGMFPTTSPIGAEGRQLMLWCRSQLHIKLSHNMLTDCNMSLHNTNASYKRRKQRERRKNEVPTRKKGFHSHQTAVLCKRCHNVPKSLNVLPACAVAPNHQGGGGGLGQDQSFTWLPGGWLAVRLTLDSP